jgi:hypothetical protein
MDAIFIGSLSTNNLDVTYIDCQCVACYDRYRPGANRRRKKPLTIRCRGGLADKSDLGLQQKETELLQIESDLAKQKVTFIERCQPLLLCF